LNHPPTAVGGISTDFRKLHPVDPDDTYEIAEKIILVLRLEHTHPNIFRPELLRRRVIELFGFESFRCAVANRLGRFPGIGSAKVETVLL
jgi:hypothetical protein